MTKIIIYLESPCCDFKVLKSVMIGKWDPEKKVTCPNCETTSEINQWNWFEKMKITFMREMNEYEVSGLLIREGPV